MDARENAAPAFHWRPLCPAAIGLLLGVLLADAFPEALRAWLAAGVMTALSLVAFAMKKRAFGILLLCMALGLCRAWATRPAALTPDVYCVEGQVCETPSYREGRWSLTLDEVCIDAQPVSGRVALFGTCGTTPKYGMRACASAEVMAESGAARTFDRYAQIIGRATADGEIRLSGAEGSGLYARLLTLREIIGRRIDALFPGSDGLMRGILLGEKSCVGNETLEGFREVGVSHLLAISGLHVSILAGAFSVLFRRSAWVRFFATSAFILLYAALTAFSPSVSRAGIMIVITLLANPLARRQDGVSALCAAFLIVVLANPYALFYAGFQLSFTAAYALIMLSPVLQRSLWWMSEPMSAAVSASVCAVAGTVPAACTFFQEVQLTGLMANLFIVPLAPLLLIPAFAGTALSFVSYPLGRIVCTPAGWMLELLRGVIAAGGSLAVSLPAPPWYAYLAFLTAIALRSDAYLRPLHQRRCAALLLLSVSAILWTLG